jgi:hypothetical protein
VLEGVDASIARALLQLFYFGEALSHTGWFLESLATLASS